MGRDSVIKYRAKLVKYYKTHTNPHKIPIILHGWSGLSAEFGRIERRRTVFEKVPEPKMTGFGRRGVTIVVSKFGFSWIFEV